MDDEQLRSAFHDRPEDGREHEPGAIVTAHSKLDVRRGFVTDRGGFEGRFYSIGVVGMDDGEKALSRALIRQTAKQAPDRPVFKEDLPAAAEGDHWIQRMLHQRSTQTIAGFGKAYSHRDLRGRRCAILSRRAQDQQVVE